MRRRFISGLDVKINFFWEERIMLKKLIVLVSVILVAGLTTDVFATAWTDLAPADHSWYTPGNWTGSEVPHIGTNANIRSMGGEYPIIDSGTATAYALYIEGTDSADVPSLTMTGGTFNVGVSGGESFNIGHGDFTYGVLDMYDGVINVTGTSFVGCRGFGTINMYGGEINMEYYKHGNKREVTDDHDAFLYLYGGIISATGIELRIDSLTDVYGGTLRILGDWVSQMNNAVTNGVLIGYGGAGDVIVDYDDTYTLVTAIPEPMTVALLGLGGLFIRRRK